MVIRFCKNSGLKVTVILMPKQHYHMVDTDDIIHYAKTLDWSPQDINNTTAL